MSCHNGFFPELADSIIAKESNEYVVITKLSSQHHHSVSHNLSQSKRCSTSMSSSFESPKNAIYIILGEIQALTSSKKNNTRWSTTPSYEESPEINPFQKLKTTLNSISDLHDIDSLTFLTPFLDIIRSDEISGPITCLALNAVNKFLSYGLIDTLSESTASTIDKVANAVTHTRFVGTNANDDEVVLMRILQVLRSLLLSPVGSQMTNDSVCEILQSCFRICFETRLSELLRKTAEHVLIDMVQLLFARLPQFKDDTTSIKRVKDLSTKTITTRTQPNNESNSSTTESSVTYSSDNDRPTAIDSATATETELSATGDASSPTILPVIIPSFEDSASNILQTHHVREEQPSQETSTTSNEFINPRGIRFTTQPSANIPAIEPLTPYGWPCVRGLFRFLTTLVNNYDKNNTEYMMTVGLNLLTVALEIGADYLSNYPLLLSIVKDTLCRNLISMLNSNRIQLYSASLRVSFLIFESLRTHLKCQFEFLITRLMEIIVSEQGKISYEHKEIALETIVQLLRIPGLPAELYLNYDCDFYSTNLFEELTKMLSKNAFPVAGLTSTHILSLDALLSVIDHIELECQFQVQRQKNDSSSQSLTHPVACGYALAVSLQNIDINRSSTPRESRHGPRLRQNRMTISSHLPSQDDLKKMKHDKKLLRQGSEMFNQSPSTGTKFLQENQLLAEPLNIPEIVKFLKDNPLLDKKIIGEYLSNRKNLHILEQYVKTFAFEEMRVDEALRIYLSEFRLPGEAPLISALLEHFAAHWRECNQFQLANNDAAFGLAYACIMLNTDQHNTNVRRQSSPMTVEDFKRNLSKMNNNENFDDGMLTEIYNAIKSDEIIMPTEQTGVVRESYLWKLMLKRSITTSGEKFLHTPTGSYNHEIFGLIWGQTMAALSFVFEKSNYDLVIEKSIQGFSKCARIAAYYLMSDVFDNLVISLCKFTTLLNNREWIENLPVQFGLNRKARLAATVVFNIAHLHGDILRDGWKNLLECISYLYKAKLLPSALVEVEDFLDPSGRTTLIKEQIIQTPKTDIGLFSSLAFFLGGGGSNDSTLASGKQPTVEEQEAIKVASSCIEECHLEQLLQETKFLIIDSLNELLKALIYGCQISLDSSKLDQDAAVFSLELLVKVVLQNRDRVTIFWPTVRHQFYSILVNANEKSFFVERTCVGLLRIAVRLLRREELASEVLTSLRMLLLVKPHVLYALSSEIAYGLYELVRSDAANIHKSDDWFILFSLLEVVGAAAPPPTLLQSSASASLTHKAIHHSQSTINAESDSECSDCITTSTTDKGYTSDTEIYRRSDYIVVSHNDVGINQNSQEKSSRHDRRALKKSSEILSFLIHDVAYVTEENFEYCIHCIRIFLEATILPVTEKTKTKSLKSKQIRKVTSSNTLNTDQSYEQTNNPLKQSRRENEDDADDDDMQETIKQDYQTLALQLLELMHTLHMRASQIFKQVSAEQTLSSVLWFKCWCPILQGIALLCCDPRRTVRSSALGYLQRCILLPELHILSPIEWESVFSKVLFPLLVKLLETTQINDHLYGIEETRVRVSQLLCRIFLQHLTPLLTLPTSTTLWLTILDFMDKYSKIDQTDMLRESVRESLKNMLLVMNTTGLFDTNPPLTVITKDRIENFLPGLWDEVFKISTPPIIPSPSAEVNKQPSSTTVTTETNIPSSELTSEATSVNEVNPVTNTRFFPGQIQNL